ncbi:hypothetical protein G6O67_008321 [Ophiocordyceps sinensis]|uniref:Uncharacterized protein n=1 Tax=Ophiocordyceps sinensis TaxID=72228 RepID=A0A8H4LSM1_9HYPO|nr:hypothetical protein G6O67_008321 [Ophiocordyceps sinensis]
MEDLGAAVLSQQCLDETARIAAQVVEVETCARRRRNCSRSSLRPREAAPWRAPTWLLGRHRLLSFGHGTGAARDNNTPDALDLGANCRVMAPLSKQPYGDASKEAPKMDGQASGPSCEADP